MSKFSIRTQTLFLTGAFLASLLVICLLAWMINNRTAEEFHRFQETVDQAESLDEVKQSVEQAIGSILSFAAGKDEAFGQLMANLDAISAELERGGEVFAEYPEDSAAMAELLKMVNDFQERATSLETVGLVGRKVLIDNELLHVLYEIRDRGDILQGRANARLELKAAAAISMIDQASLLLLGVAGAVVPLAVGLALVFGQRLTVPIRSAAESVRQLADRQYDTEISGTHRGDEIGAIAQGLEALRLKLLQADEAEVRIAAENGRRVDLFQTLGVAMGKLRGGALSSRINAEDWGDLGGSYVKLCGDFNDLASALENLVDALQVSTETVQENARELSGMSDDMSRRAETQAATLEQSAAALDVLSVGVNTAADKAEEADKKVGEGRRRAEQGGEVMGRALQAMNSIAKSSEQISQIIGVIDDIAFQTNLLALNAGVEAARAGESGKGFSVVASEVRGLAQRASASANQIKELVLNSVNQVEDGERLVHQTSETLTHIVESVTEVSAMVSDIAALSRDQASGVAEINIGIGELDKVTQQNAAMVSETSTASQQLTVEATRLSDVLARFSGGKEIMAQQIPTESGVPELFGGAADVELFDAPPLRPRSGNGATAQNLPKDVLVHGSWAAEMDDPEPVPIEPPQNLPENKPTKQAVKAPKPRVPAAEPSQNIGNGAWTDF